MSPLMFYLLVVGLSLILISIVMGANGKEPRYDDPWVLEHTDVYGRSRWQPRREPMGLYHALVLEAADGYDRLWTSAPGGRRPTLYRSKARAARVARRAEFRDHGFRPSTTRGQARGGDR